MVKVVTIFSDFRNGSTYLLKLLSNFANCHAYDEPFDEWHFNHDIKHCLSENMQNYDEATKNGYEFINDMIDSQKDKELVILKMNGYQGIEFWDHLIEKSDFVILNYRKDSLAVIKSHLMALNISEWYNIDTTTNKVWIPLKQLESMMCERLRLHTIQRDRIRNSNHAVITYEDIHQIGNTDDTKFNYVINNLPFFKPFKVNQINQQLRKQSRSKDVYDNITNSKQVKEYMSRIPNFLKSINI